MLAAPFIILLSTLSAASGQVYDRRIPTPECTKFKTIKFKGDAEFVNTDGGFVFGVPQTTGDMSIAEEYNAVPAFGSYPHQPFVFYNINLKYKTICLVTKDQPTGGPISSPTCFYEFDGGFCNRWWWFFYLSSVKVEYVNPAKVISIKKISEALAELGLDEDGSDPKSDPGSDSEPNNNNNNKRNTRGGERALNVFEQENIAETDKKGNVAAIQLTRNFVRNSEANKDLVAMICPQFGCWIPYFWNCRKGGFTAHGSGPDSIEITGGSNGFFGAFGQINTPTPFDVGTVQPNGDLVGSSIDMDIELCFYKKEQRPRIFGSPY